MRRYADDPIGDESHLERARLGMRKVRESRDAAAREELARMLATLYERDAESQLSTKILIKDWLAWSADAVRRPADTARAGFRRVWLYRQLESRGLRIERGDRIWGAMIPGLRRKAVI